MTFVKDSWPRATCRPRELNYHGQVFVDDYFWLRDKENPEVIDYLKAENLYTDAYMSDTEELRQQLFEEMKGRIREVDSTVPVKIDEYYYYSRTEEGRQYRVHCRKLGENGEEEVILDLNRLAEGKKYLALGGYETSPDHRYLAYAIDDDGSEYYTIYILDLKKSSVDKPVILSEIESTCGSMEWAADSAHLFYVALDDANRPYKLFCHRRPDKPAKNSDEEIFHEIDQKFFLELYKTLDQKYIFLSSKSQVTSEIRYLNADLTAAAGNKEFKILIPRRYGIEYQVDHRQGWFYLMTNDNALNFRVFKVPADNPCRERAMEVIPHRPEVKIESITLFNRYLVSIERHDGLREIIVRELNEGETGEPWRVELPEPVHDLFEGYNVEFYGNKFRFHYTSLKTPPTVYDYDLSTRTLECLKVEDIPSGYDPDCYRTERLWAVSHDGVKVPISVVYPADIKKDGSNPVYLYGYGSYGITEEPDFNRNMLSLLERGFVYAVAHMRGGSELGRGWYEQGKYLNKKNTFLDFIAAGEHLIKEGFTSPQKLVIHGGSAGGMLMGAVTNLRPDLFAGVCAEVPFVDVINTMMDPTLPLTVIEYDEWGDPNDKKFFDYMLSYSPYENLEAKDYPNILMVGGLNDPRVGYWEPAKYTARLRTLKTDENILLLKTYMSEGHGGVSGRYDRLHETAFRFAFFLKVLNLNKPVC